MNVEIVALTQPFVKDKTGKTLTAEEFIVYAARVSSPSNQLNLETAPQLIRYCIKRGHWSIFDQVYMTLEIRTSRAIAAQMLRHWSFRFQEFSQRYAAVDSKGWEQTQLRESHAKGNRQGSGQTIDVTDPRQVKFDEAVSGAFSCYTGLLEQGIAPESARMCLPLCTATTLYMTGSVRSWIHYFAQRVDSHAQLEHQVVAGEGLMIFKEHFPNIVEALAHEDVKELASAAPLLT
jgi:thymidylate synthase (FAD)